MAEYRSYARQGQFSGRIQAPQTAKAKRKRDLEMVDELKEENQALKDRDAEFLAAYKEKIKNEAAARADVEEARRYSVESERKQRIANFNLAADFAQLEQEARNETLEAFGEMLPKVGTYLKDEGERREKAETAEADAAIARSGLTPEELREYSKISWTADLLNSEKHAALKARLDAGGISYKQFIDIVNRRGIWGRSGARWELMQRAKSGSTALTQSITDGFEYEGVPLGAALSGEVPGNDRRVVEEWYRDWYRKQFEGFNPVFVEETIGEDLARFENSLYATSNEKAEEQAFGEWEAGERQALITAYNSPNGIAARLDPYKTDVGRYQQVQQDVKSFATAIESGEIPHDSDLIDNLRNVQVFNPSKDAPNKVGEDSRLYPILDAAVATRQRQILSEGEARRGERNAAREEEWHIMYHSILDAPADQQEGIIRGYLDDPNIDHDHKAKLARMIEESNAIKTIQIEESLEYYRKNNIPITQSVVDSLNAPGALGRQLAKEARDYETLGQKAYEDEVKKDFDKMIKIRTKSEHDDGQTGSDEHGLIFRLMMQDYRRRKAAYKHLGPEQAHIQARRDVEKQFENGVKPDSEGYATNTYQYHEDPQNPLNHSWPNAGRPLQTLPEPLELTQKHRKNGDNVVNVPGAIFTTQQLSQFSTPDKVTQRDWLVADDVALLTSARDTGAHVIKKQMEAVGMEVPAWLNETVEAHDKLIQINSANRQAIIQSHKPGEQPFAANNLKTSLPVQYNEPVSTDGLSRQVGITGERGRIGVGDEHHIDVKLSQSLPIEQRVMHFDAIAWMYHREGRVVEFSNQAVAGIQWNVMWSDAKKLEVYKAITAAHGHSVHSGWDSIDYYVPSKGHNRNHSSAEFAPIYVPTIQGGKMIQKTGGGYGFNSEIYDSYGNLTIRIGHGRTSDPMNKPIFNPGDWY